MDDSELAEQDLHDRRMARGEDKQRELATLRAECARLLEENAALFTAHTEEEMNALRDFRKLGEQRDAAIARAESAEAQAAALREALMGLYPSANNPADLCFCQPCHDVQDFGHQARCIKARSAIRASLGKEGA